MSEIPSGSPGSAEKNRASPATTSAEKGVATPVTQENAEKSKETAAKNGEAEEERAVWGNQVQFILSTVGLAVGLGNIWKFPGLAYANGGSAFLFPYITCAIIFALPLVYCEFVVGQYSSTSPAQALRKYAPAFQGLGWSMALLAGSVAIYYTVIIAWSGVYMAWIVTGRMDQWTSCDNSWNTINCISVAKSITCKDTNASLPFFVNGTCIDSSFGLVTAAEEFFQKNIVNKSESMLDMGGINWQLLVSLVIMWIIVYLTLIKGVEYLGYASYVTSTLPYVIIVIMFVRGVTLEGASTGIDFYLGKPDWAKVYDPRTWVLAVTQLLFSISIGYGGLIALASYSRFDNNCFKDALIVIVGDTFMSVFGGVAVFSTLGFLANLMGKRVDQVVESGLSLAFIVYPEAIAQMEWPWLWAMLFFIMLFCLGLGSEVALVEVLCSNIYDQFPSTRKKKWLVSLCVCFAYFSLGFIMVTGSGWYWFNLYNEVTGTTSACLIAALEAICIGTVYGVKNYRKDQIAMLGEPKNKFLAMIGPTAPYWGWTLAVVCPILALVIAGFTVEASLSLNIMKNVENENGTLEKIIAYPFPTWAHIVGWFLNIGPIIAVPVYFGINFWKNLREGMGVKSSIVELFKIQKDHRSYGRIVGEKNGEASQPQSSANPDKGPDDNANKPESPLVQTSNSKESPKDISKLEV